MAERVLSIRSQLLVLSGACLALITILSAIVVVSARSDADALRDLYERKFQPMLALQDVDRQLKEVRFRLAGVLLDQIPVPGTRNHLKEVRQSAPAMWKGFAGASGDADGERAQLMRKIDAGWMQFEGYAASLEEAYAANDRKKLAALLEDGWPKIQLEIVKPLERLLPLAVADAESVYAVRSAAATRRQVVAIAGFIASTLILAGILFWFNRRLQDGFARMSAAMRSLARGDLTTRLESRACAETVAIGDEFNEALKQLHNLVARARSASEEIRDSAGEIARGHTDLSTRTEEQASSLEQTAASMEEMSATVAQNAENAKKATLHASAASDVAARGGHAVGAVVTTMSGISASSKKIADIIGVIDGIAFQTNILALNAAVEAARAGEQGRGFAVVASEVRSLAQRSAAAAKEIRQLISDSVGRIDAGSKQVAEAGKTMEEIVESVKRVNGLIEEISAASQEQSQSLAQVSDTVQQLEKVTQQNAAMVQEATAASASMEEQAKSLQDAVKGFTLVNRVRAPEASPEQHRRAAPAATAPSPAPAAPALPKEKKIPVAEAPRRQPDARGDKRPDAKPRADDEGWEEF
jgi:methyl-accepting chemotaxis protein